MTGETAPQLGDASPVSSLASATAAGSQPPQESASPTAISASFAQDWKPARVAPAGLRLIPQTPQPSTTATEQIRTAGEQGAPVTEHISTTGEQGASVTEQISTAGVQGASVTEQISIAGRQGASVQEEASAVSLLNPESSRLEYAEVQTDSQLPLFALDSVLWPNQLMRLRYSRLCLRSECHTSNVERLLVHWDHGSKGVEPYAPSPGWHALSINVAIIMIVDRNSTLPSGISHGSFGSTNCTTVLTLARNLVLACNQLSISDLLLDLGDMSTATAAFMHR